MRKGADNHKVSAHAIGPSSRDSRSETFHGLGRKTLTSSGRVQMTTLVSACQSYLGSPNDEVWITVRCLCILSLFEDHMFFLAILWFLVVLIDYYMTFGW